ncbi:MAG: hypothetical protein LKF00_01870 [Olsenella sp.]|jgi:hypothetical protein|nr:hypothetical protein [Olsenella sp.]MCI1288625.1 hypothetical protein [Olsenella sp.]
MDQSDLNRARATRQTEHDGSDQDIPDFLVEAAQAPSHHASGADDARSLGEKDATAAATPSDGGMNASAAGTNAAQGGAPEPVDGTANATDATSEDDLLGFDDYADYGDYPYATPDQPNADGRKPMDPAAYETGELDWQTGAGASGSTMGRSPYVRQRTPHKTQPAIDDNAEDGAYAPEGYAHDSNIAIGGVLSGGHTYRRARKAKAAVQRGRYGQYLEVPKGKRSIFATRTQMRRRRSLLTTIAIILVFVVVAIIIAQMVSRLG